MIKVLLDSCVWGGIKLYFEKEGYDIVWCGDWDYKEDNDLGDWNYSIFPEDL